MIDLVKMQLASWSNDDEILWSDIPAEEQERAEQAREQLVEAAAENDDELAELFLEGQPIDEARLKQAIRAGCIANQLVPVTCGSALRNRGPRLLLDAVVDYLPSPLDVPPAEGTNPGTEQSETRPAQSKAPFSALSFKVQMEQGRKVVYLRIYSGLLKPSDDVLNVRVRKKEKIARLFQVHANRRERIQQAGPGMIVAAMGLKLTGTGDTLCAASAPILYEPIDSYEPVIARAIEPKTLAEKEKLEFGLAKMTEEDPTFRVKEDEETGQTLIRGMGELHLDIIVDRLVREYGVEARVGKPQVVYRETVTAGGRGESTFERQLEEGELFGQATVSVEPQERGAGMSFEQRVPVVEPPVAQSLVDAAMEGLREAATAGVSSGYPLVDIRCTLVDLGLKEGAVNPVPYKVAAGEAFRRACREAKPALLEPIMEVEVIVPEEFMGEIIGDLNQRNGQIDDVGFRTTRRCVRARVPMREMFGYSTRVRSLSQGRANFTMRFYSFDVAG